MVINKLLLSDCQEDIDIAMNTMDWTDEADLPEFFWVYNLRYTFFKENNIYLLNKEGKENWQCWETIDTEYYEFLKNELREINGK